MSKIRPLKRLVISERTNFLARKQKSREGIYEYVQRLWESARFCEFNGINIPSAPQIAENDLIQTRLIVGLASAEHRVKLFEFLQASPTPILLKGCVQHLQQLELIDKFAQSRATYVSPETLTEPPTTTSTNPWTRHFTDERVNTADRLIRKSSAPPMVRRVLHSQRKIISLACAETAK